MNCFRFFASMHTRVDVVARAHRLLDWREDSAKSFLQEAKSKTRSKLKSSMNMAKYNSVSLSSQLTSAVYHVTIQTLARVPSIYLTFDGISLAVVRVVS